MYRANYARILLIYHIPKARAAAITLQNKNGGPRVRRSCQKAARRGRRSVEEVAVLLDIVGQVQRVLTHQPLGQLRVALFQRLDDAQVIDDRSRRTIALRDRHLPDGPYVDENIADRVHD